MPHYGPSGGPVVSVIVFYSDNPSLNPAKANIFSGKFVFEKNENKQKESGGWSILNTCHITLIHKSLLIDLKYQQSAIILFQHKFAFLKWASFFYFQSFQSNNTILQHKLMWKMSFQYLETGLKLKSLWFWASFLNHFVEQGSRPINLYLSSKFDCNNFPFFCFSIWWLIKCLRCKEECRFCALESVTRFGYISPL